MKIIGLTGYATTGKDTAAQALIALGWERVSFADPLREMALAIDPIVLLGNQGGANPEWKDDGSLVVCGLARIHPIRLAEMVEQDGWGMAKSYPEVRRLLQKIGTEAVRNIIGKDTWVNLAKRKIFESTAPGVVLTDVRFANEAAMVRSLGGQIYRVDKPGVGPVNGHVSDDAISHLHVDGIIDNSGTVEQLHAAILALAECVPA